jgi:uracil-DNA glycosylase
VTAAAPGKVKRVSAAEFLPDRITLPALREAAGHCRGCELWAPATQTVFGDGPPRARLMLVGEQPGDKEDRQGAPFVGPAGRILDEALDAAGIDRGEVYVTNAVKHFRFQERGKRRIHQRPDRSHVKACRPWLDAELEAVVPEAIACLGAVAAQALLGPKVKVTTDRGRFLESDLPSPVLVTVHPSSILRVTDRADREAAMSGLVDDLRVVAKALSRAGAAASR